MVRFLGSAAELAGLGSTSKGLQGTLACTHHSARTPCLKIPSHLEAGLPHTWYCKLHLGSCPHYREFLYSLPIFQQVEIKCLFSQDSVRIGDSGVKNPSDG